MKDDIKDRAAIHTPPPLIFFACLGMGILLEYSFPFRFITGAWPLRIIIGCFLLLVSGLMAVSAFIALIKNKTPFNPAKPTKKIVCEGSFRFSRNPLYLALLLLLSVAAVMAGSIWLVLALLILFILLERFAVRPEEKYLTDKFGEDYLNYKASVRRWL
ncbi:MAG: isoprenylcysteine carboxylmethyltransferase family protein [Proteobacteria bacterium]|nr:isoprenylcysteine carboxylmethyltransferase family protein [Pseudomonadota bacterium]